MMTPTTMPITMELSPDLKICMIFTLPPDSHSQVLNDRALIQISSSHKLTAYVVFVNI